MAASSGVPAVWALDNPALRQYALCSAVLALKLLVMALLTARKRMANKAFASPEDAEFSKTKVKTDPEVERVRRAHLNDLENIPAFWILGLLFLLTEPSALVSTVCYYTFTGARIGHTVMYLNGVMPLRALCFAIGSLVNVFMAGSIIYAFL